MRGRMGGMLDTDRLRANELECGFRYPEFLWVAATELQAIVSDPDFAKQFPEARTATPQDIKEACDIGLDCTELFPFMCVPLPFDADYYCCGFNEPQVSVFAVHAVVRDWPTFAAFIKW